MRILLFGTTGQVARSLLSLEWGDDTDLISVGREQADLANKGAVSASIRQHAPDVVVNAAAYTAVDKAESEEEIALQVNALAPKEMAETCASLSIPFVHLSTDFVFEGTKEGPYDEADTVGPVSAYGRSKLAGEEAIRTVLQQHVIVRTAWVFSEYGNNFVKTMLRLGAERDALGIVADQTGCPTSALGIAKAVQRIVTDLNSQDNRRFGTFHYCGNEAVTWYSFAKAIFQSAGDRLPNMPNVSPISTDQYPTPAKRPANSVLSCEKIADVYGIEPDDWRMGLDRVVGRLFG